MNVTLEQWALVLTAIAAWVALGISLYNLWQGCPRRRVEVVFPGQEQFLVPLGPPRVTITFVNEQGPVVVIKKVGFEYGGHLLSLAFPGSRGATLPREVPPEDSASFPVALATLRHFIEEEEFPLPTRAFCIDAIGRYFWSPPFSRESRSLFIISPREQGEPEGGI